MRIVLAFRPMRLHIALDDDLVDEIDQRAGPRRAPGVDRTASSRRLELPRIPEEAAPAKLLSARETDP